MLPRLPCLYGYELLRKPSQAKNETVPMVSAAVVGLLVTILSGDYTVNYTSLGWLGAALARSLGYMSMLPTMYGVMYFMPQLWSGFKVKEANTREKISKFLSLGIPGMLQLVIEVLGYEMISLLCGLLTEGEAILAIGASAISLQVALFVYKFSLGASAVASICSKSSVSDCFLKCACVSSHRLFCWKCIGGSRRASSQDGLIPGRSCSNVLCIFTFRHFNVQMQILITKTIF